MNIDIENFLASHPFSESTKKKYRLLLAPLAVRTNLNQLSAADLIASINKPTWGNSQQSLALYASQKFLRWLYGSVHPALSAKLKRIHPKPRRALTRDKALQLLASFNTYTPIGARDLAIVAFGLDTGFRRAEICSMQIHDIDFENNTAITLCKGGQYKYGAFSPETADILQSWLQVRSAPSSVNNIFVNIHTGAALTGDGLGCIFKHWSKSFALKISPHDLRSSFATLTTIYGAPSRTVQVAGRWSSMEMVEHYTGTLQLDAVRKYLPMHNIKASLTEM